MAAEIAVPKSKVGASKKAIGEKERFIMSAASIDSCVYAKTDSFFNNAELVHRRLVRLATDARMKLDLSTVFVLTSSDTQRDILKSLLKSDSLSLSKIKVENINNLALVDTKSLFSSVKYLFCVDIANFKVVNIYNILNIAKGKHLTLTDNIHRITNKLEEARNHLKTFFGSHLKTFTFSSGEKRQLVAGSMQGSPSVTSFTPSIEHIRSIVNKESLCSKVHRGLAEINNEEDIMQLVHRLLSNPTDSVAFLITMSYMHFPNGKRITKSNMTRLCNIIERENFVNGEISALDFFVKFDSSLDLFKYITQPVIDACGTVKRKKYSSVVKAVAKILLGMQREPLFSRFKAEAEVSKSSIRADDNRTWLERLFEDFRLVDCTPIKDLAKISKSVDGLVNAMADTLTSVSLSSSFSNNTPQRMIATPRAKLPQFVPVRANIGLKLVKRR